MSVQARAPSSTNEALPGTGDVTPAMFAADRASSAWDDFKGDKWRLEIDVSDFIHHNVTPYVDGPEFLEGATARTQRLWGALQPLLEREKARGLLEVSQVPSSITAHGPGYIDRSLELIFGLQTDAPLRRAVFPHRGRTALESALAAYGIAIGPDLLQTFGGGSKTHHTAALDAYPSDVAKAKRARILAGLPDAYGRGRIIGDYRRVALYGVDWLIREKEGQRQRLDEQPSDEETIRDREELRDQIRALGELLAMAGSYGIDISGPATTAQEAVQWLYFAYLAAIKEQDGSAMSLGRTSSFLDIYLSRDLALGRLNESGAQELIDDLVIKLRLVRFLRTPRYRELFPDEPTWVTETIGGTAEDGRSLVTRTSFRMLQTLRTLGSAPEPCFVVLWSSELPAPFKRFCAELSLQTSLLRYVSDELIQRYAGDDTAIACSTSVTRLGEQAVLCGGHVMLPQCLLCALNGGRDHVSGEQVMPQLEPLADELSIDDVLRRFERALDWLADTYVSAMNCLRYMHDRYAYERLEMALIDYPSERKMAFGIAGLLEVVDLLSAIRHARVTGIRDASNLIVDFRVEGDFPRFGDDDERVDELAGWVLDGFMARLNQRQTYRGALPTLSVLSGEPPGLAQAALAVAKLPYEACQDGVAFTATVSATSLDASDRERWHQLQDLLDLWISSGLYQVHVKVVP